MAAAAQGGLNAHAQTSFAKSAAYDQHRPSYSPTVVQLLLEKVGVAGKNGARILDLAAGSGKFTELLAAREEGYEILAVEPHDGMRGVLVAKKLPRVTVIDGTGESMPKVESGSVDAVTVAQGFHWFANMTALKEIYRVMQRHAALGLIWNAEDWNAPRDHKASTPWEAKIHQLTANVVKKSGDREPRFRDLQWRNVFDEQVKKTPLSLIRADGDQLFSLPIGEEQEPFEVALTKEQSWERYNTLGHISVLERDQREEVYKTFMDAINEPDVEKNGKGEVVVHGKTYMVWTTKIPAEGREALTTVESPGP